MIKELIVKQKKTVVFPMVNLLTNEYYHKILDFIIGSELLKVCNTNRC